MKLHNIDAGDIKPCKHMEGLVSSRADERLTGLAKLYTDWHISQCTRCQDGLKTLMALKERLGALDAKDGAEELSDDLWSALEAGWSKIESSHGVK
jgi:hypothetical protein